MKVLVILGHQRQGSFCHAIAQAAMEELRAAGHEVIYHDLYAEGFDPILPEAEMTCDHVIIIHGGRIAATGTPEELKALRGAASGGITLEADGPADRVEQVVAAIDGVSSVRRRVEGGRSVFHVDTRGRIDVRAEISRRLAEKGWPVLELHRNTATLEDVFVGLTMREG